MSKLTELKSHLKKGNVYRRADLTKWSRSVDRHLDALLKEGTLEKVSPGVYYAPKETVFGKTPPTEAALVKAFLKDDRFLLTSSNAYNSLGIGATQLYNERIVYNHKRHGIFKLGKKNYNFQMKPHFPTKLTPEFLLVDMLNNLDKLAEDKQVLLKNALNRAVEMDKKKLKKSVIEYGGVKAKKFLEELIS